jgi:hypothetical protein
MAGNTPAMTGWGGSALDGSGSELLRNRYRLIDRLGSGGMSVVWRAHDEVLDRPVAVKMLATRLANDRIFRRRIRAEARAAARLCHPHITGVYDYGEALVGGATVPYVVMELIEGESMAARLGRLGRLPWRLAVLSCAQVAGALAVAHARGVVHRDVTPGNVMLTPIGAKVLDFGISALVGEQEAGPDGNLLGTPAYLAPERLDGRPVCPATDVYALGLLLYRTLTGRLPWAVRTTRQMLQAHLHHNPAPMPPVAGLPPTVVQLISRCLAKSPEDRPSSVEVARTLAAALGPAAVVPVTPTDGGAGDVETGPMPVPDDSVQRNLPGTGVLPWEPNTDALPPESRPDRLDRGRLQAAAVGVALLAVTGAVWAVTVTASVQAGASDPIRSAGITGAHSAGSADAPGTDCRARYVHRRDPGGRFEVGSPVDPVPLPAWAPGTSEAAATYPGSLGRRGGERAGSQPREEKACT